MVRSFGEIYWYPTKLGLINISSGTKYLSKRNVYICCKSISESLCILQFLGPLFLEPNPESFKKVKMSQCNFLTMPKTVNISALWTVIAHLFINHICNQIICYHLHYRCRVRGYAVKQVKKCNENYRDAKSWSLLRPWDATILMGYTQQPMVGLNIFETVQVPGTQPHRNPTRTLIWICLYTLCGGWEGTMNRKSHTSQNV